MSGDFEAAPVMTATPALVTKPVSHFISPPTAYSTIGFGAAPGPNGDALLCVQICHHGGDTLVAAVPEKFLSTLLEVLNDAVDQVRSRRFATGGTTQ